MDELLGEIVAQRIMLAQLTAFIASKQDDRDLFVANFREGCLRSLDFSIGGAPDRMSNDTLFRAQAIIESSCDSVGRAA